MADQVTHKKAEIRYGTREGSRKKEPLVDSRGGGRQSISPASIVPNVSVGRYLRYLRGSTVLSMKWEGVRRGPSLKGNRNIFQGGSPVHERQERMVPEGDDRVVHDSESGVATLPSQATLVHLHTQSRI